MAKVLVVDDNEDNRNVLSRLLAHGGHSAVCAVDGRRAIEVAGIERPDLVLMDLEMPEMDGWAATRVLKGLAELTHVPVIAVTGHLTQNEIDRAQRAGCDDVVSKPIDFYVLMEKIELHLASGSHRPAPSDDPRPEPASPNPYPAPPSGAHRSCAP